MAHSRGPNGALMRSERVFQSVVNPVTTRAMLEFRILGPLEVLDEGNARRRSAAGISAPCWRCCSCARTSRSRPSVSSISSGASIRRGRRRRRSRTRSSQLRKLLGAGLLLTRPTGYVLELDADQLDLTRFERLVREARSARADEQRPISSARRSGSGAARRSPTSSRRRSRSRRSSDSKTCGSACSRSGSPPISSCGADAELVAEIEALVRAHPLRERLRAN